ncbi:N(G),N(G)-dimethylarginine dimethylaminohydrolase [Aerococcus urinaehominis]|uniref:N(G),N(G)-dimethylarginine dimethylaminohydrolase n=1 Tax=Aerococcus urinaehominis TaxID=128944 RepID=A0A0X8FLB2_9LACT|nr:arginine deiminase family protein [Aerococcus urinaehominis]AMB99405.1 N(G),N(G)-dimethylarginine dimethylaminohydrolase [Aerococcus urinaehominis]SDM24099.1 dimethylargininase [Aerococcus urinaehominis]
MFKHTIVRKPSPSISQGISSANLGQPDYQKALAQHEKYVQALKETGVDVTVLEAQNDFPDACFVEDVALCTSECAIITRPGAASRQDESQLSDMRRALHHFYDHVEEIQAPGTIEGGDIMMVGNHYYIGLSDRTNQAGADQMISLLEEYGLSGSVVAMDEMLHLKTGVNFIPENTVLVAGEFQDRPEFADFKQILIEEDEAYAANSVWINDYVLVPAGYPKTREKIAQLGYQIIEVDTSEFRKIDGGLSCLSLRF